MSSIEHGRRSRRLPTPAMAVAVAALVVALAGTAIAVTKAPKNSVVSKSIKNGQVKESDLGSSAVTSAKLAEGAVNSGKLAEGAVSSGKLAEGAVSSGKIAEGSVTSGKIAETTIGLGKLDGAVSAAFAGAGPVTYVEDTGGATDGGQAAPTAECPAGTRAVAGGYATTAAGSSTDIFANASRPNIVPSNIPPTGTEVANSWRAVVVNETGGTNPGTVQVTAYAICMT
jgi:hypothetical protein